ncbi:MAG TPA: xanthine dehydrogenase family protein molybdopterin-binding subunit [Acidobacteriaceae bacterium]|jgi:xanthine dehydrogenase YagR molybdenum-binding subunit|nr:xanthine dehydrogenase family protein molybdopterin-binding subunit [Acidobacteriaceae bacterium]
MSTSLIGAAVTRIDGPLKVTGAAPYAVDHPVENLAYGVGVASTIGNGRVTRVDASAAEKMSGVLAVLHHGNSLRLYRPGGPFEQESRAGESRPPFEDDTVYYYGQFVALVVANTFAQANAAAAAVKVEYAAEKPAVVLEEQDRAPGDPKQHYQRGNPEEAFAGAPVRIDYTYETPTETHNPMEMHGTIAVWNGDRLRLYETTQGVVNHRNVLSEMLGVPLDRIEVISPFCGAGFGGKLFPWPQSLLAAMAAKKVNRPVQVVVPRSLEFTTVGHRPRTQQRMRMGAQQDGTLVAIVQDVLQPTSKIDSFTENCTGVTRMLYSCPNVATTQEVVSLNIGTPTPMRGPGTTPGLYALDAAMDDLALKLNMDPLQLRLKNYAEKDESENLPFSGKHLKECYQVGAERFGWAKRNPAVGSMKSGNEILGWGMGTSTWHAGRGSATVRVRLGADGRVRTSSATQDIGTGMYTVFAIVVAQKLGIPIDRVDVALGDTALPPGPMSGGSTATASVLPAIDQATDKVTQLLFELATRTAGSPFEKADARTLALTNGRVHGQGQDPESGVPFEKLLQLRRVASLEAEAHTGGADETGKYSSHCFGAQFIEVAWDPGIARLRVTRSVTAIDAGRIISEKTARNQILGGVVWGISMGMFEETIYDPRNAKPINNNYADYLIPTNADIEQMECHFVQYPDLHLNEYGARGLGEIGLTGVASALTMAVYHATGIRVRRLPIRLENLMSGQQRSA